MNCPDRVNVLLVGSGGREHALARALRRSPRLGELWVDPGANPGIASLGRIADIPLDVKQSYRARQFCDAKGIGLVVIGPEDPLAAGFADELAKGPGGSVRPVLGPSGRAARLEADKSYAKKLMRDASIPTADGRTFEDYESARAFLESRSEPHVIKAAGLAKGKGVIVPENDREGLEALERIMKAREFGDAGRRVVIEERLEGAEASVLALVDGRNILMLPACRDHKRLGEGDTGPNTGGMGAICAGPGEPGPIDEATLARVDREVFVPIVDALKRDESDFRGVLYAGMMLTPAGPKVLEFNVRFGDPECQPLLMRLRTDLLDVLEATADGRLDEIGGLDWDPRPAVCVVMASEGYPGSYTKGHPIRGLDEAAKLPGVKVFHAGTKEKDGQVVNAGGRVLNVTALGDTIAAAKLNAYTAVKCIRWEGAWCRKDISDKALG